MNYIYQSLLYFHMISNKIIHLTIQLIYDLISIVHDNNYTIV